MPATIAVQMIQQGLLIPRTALADWGTKELEAVWEEHAIVIRPKALPPAQKRDLMREAVTDALREDGLLVEMTGEPLFPPVTPDERAKLAKRLDTGRPLSEIVIEERRAGW